MLAQIGAEQFTQHTVWIPYKAHISMFTASKIVTKLQVKKDFSLTIFRNMNTKLKWRKNKVNEAQTPPFLLSFPRKNNKCWSSF